MINKPCHLPQVHIKTSQIVAYAKGDQYFIKEHEVNLTRNHPQRLKNMLAPWHFHYCTKRYNLETDNWTTIKGRSPYVMKKWWLSVKDNVQTNKKENLKIRKQINTIHEIDHGFRSNTVKWTNYMFKVQQKTHWFDQISSSISKEIKKTKLHYHLSFSSEFWFFLFIFHFL